MPNIFLLKHEIKTKPHTYYVLSGLKVNTEMLDRVFELEGAIRNSKVEHERLRQVSEYHVAMARIGRDGCKCRVNPGMTVDLIMRYEGCKTGRGNVEQLEDGSTLRSFDAGYVCPHLVSLRKLYGH